MIGVEVRFAVLAKALLLMLDVLGWCVVAMLRKDTAERRAQGAKLAEAKELVAALAGPGGDG